MNLGFTKIFSPIDGIVGIAVAQVGDLVNPTSGILTTVSTVDPIKVYFTLGEQEYLAYVKLNPNPAERAAAQKELELQLFLADGSTYPHTGKFYIADRQVDPKTGAIRIAGVFANPDNTLRPGQYGRVRAATSTQAGALLIPQRAVSQLQGMYRVAVVGSDNKVVMRTITPGPTVGQMWKPEQTVRVYHRHLRAVVGFQRSNTLTGPGRVAPQAAKRIEPGSPSGQPAWGATHGYVNVSHALIRKSVIAVLILAGFAVATGLLGYRLPTSFLPTEDYGYMYVNVQLPPAASMERTDQALKKVEAILAKTAGVQYYTTVSGFSNLSRVSASYQGFFFVALKPWAERIKPELQVQGIVATLNKEMAAQVPEANCIALMPPAIPGLGNAGGFSMYIQDRSGGTVQVLDQNLQKFLDAARKRPELTGVTSQFNSSVPQIYADVDRDKVLKQGVAISDVHQTLQAYLGGLFLNQFNRFGRQWRVFLQGEGEQRLKAEDIKGYYVRNNDGNMVPLSALLTTIPITGPEYTNRFNLFRAAQVIGNAAPGYSSGQALAALDEVARTTLPPEMGYDWADLSYQETKASGSATTTFALSLAFVFLILAALYESWSLPFSVLFSVPVAIFGAFIGLMLIKALNEPAEQAAA